MLAAICSRDSRVSYRIFYWGGGEFFFVQMRRHAMHTALLGGLGACPPPQESLGKLAALRLILVGLGGISPLYWSTACA